VTTKGGLRQGIVELRLQVQAVEVDQRDGCVAGGASLHEPYNRTVHGVGVRQVARAAAGARHRPRSWHVSQEGIDAGLGGLFAGHNSDGTRLVDDVDHEDATPPVGLADGTDVDDPMGQAGSVSTPGLIVDEES